MDESEDQIYEQHIGLIKSLTNSIVVNNTSVVSNEDLQQAGAMALIVALKSYDPSLGSFQSYIRRCIRNALLEQANAFNSVFTVDEKVRRQANSISKLRKQGLSDDAIMGRLGIKTRATFLSLLELSDGAVDIDQIEAIADTGFNEASILDVLDEIGLDETEMKFVNLTIQQYSISDLEQEMDLSRAQLYRLKASIRDKILAWGKSK